MDNDRHSQIARAMTHPQVIIASVMRHGTARIDPLLTGPEREKLDQVSMKVGRMVIDTLAAYGLFIVPGKITAPMKLYLDSDFAVRQPAADRFAGLLIVVELERLLGEAKAIEEVEKMIGGGEERAPAPGEPSLEAQGGSL